MAQDGSQVKGVVVIVHVFFGNPSLEPGWKMECFGAICGRTQHDVIELIAYRYMYTVENIRSEFLLGISFATKPHGAHELHAFP